MTIKKSKSPEEEEVWADFNDGYIDAHERDRRLAELKHYDKRPANIKGFDLYSGTGDYDER